MPNVDLRSPGAWRELPPDAVQRFDAELAPVLKRYPEDRKASAMIPALRLGEHIFGWLSPPVMALAADRLGVSPTRAEEVATFYVMFRTQPTGRHLVEL
jgi:NADH-quinone oxidoreductase subunit E